MKDAPAPIDVKRMNRSLHMEWYSYGQRQTPSDSAKSWLGLTLFSPKLAAYVCWLPMDYPTPPTLRIGESYGGSISPQTSTPGLTFKGCAQPLTLRRYPGGAVRIYEVLASKG